MRRLRGAAGSVRPRVWLAAAASLAALLAALVLLPGHGVARAPALPAGSPPTASPPTASPPPESPVPAAEALLAARARCLAGRAPACLAAVDAAGSPVDGLDRASLVAGVEPVLPPAATPVLVARTGATAVLSVGPDTVLLIRGADGWRLRDVLAPTPSGGQMPSEPVKSPSSSRARTAVRNRAASAPSTIRWS